MPLPVSVTESTIHWPGPGPEPSAAAARRSWARRKRSSPPSGITSRALTARLVSTWVSWFGSALTDERALAGLDDDGDGLRQRALEQAHRLLQQHGDVERSPARAATAG